MLKFYFFFKEETTKKKTAAAAATEKKLAELLLILFLKCVCVCERGIMSKLLHLSVDNVSTCLYILFNIDHIMHHLFLNDTYIIYCETAIHLCIWVICMKLRRNSLLISSSMFFFNYICVYKMEWNGWLKIDYLLVYIIFFYFNLIMRL